MCPRSRSGKNNEFNLFPYKTDRHRSWHAIFLNMTIWEVWNRVEDIYSSIWLADDDAITRPWLSVCKLQKKALKKALNNKYNVFYLREMWINAFGGWKLDRAKRTLEYMILFIIFGSDMAYEDKIFSDSDLAAFFKKYPVTGERHWALQACFGENASWQSIKHKISQIFGRSPC